MTIRSYYICNHTAFCQFENKKIKCKCYVRLEVFKPRSKHQEGFTKEAVGIRKSFLKIFI